MKISKPFFASLLAIMCTTVAHAQETDIAGKVSLELNAAETVNDACTLTFLITNGLDDQIDKVIYETVLLDQSGQVDRLTLFDFGRLPPARPRVRQFSVPTITCDQLGQVIFNGANTCEGDNTDPTVCETGLMLSTRTAIEVSG